MSASSANKGLVLSVYKKLLREGSKFPSYNYREYAIRRTRDTFRDNKLITDGAVIKVQIQEAVENLEIIKRQVIIGNLYMADKLVIEK